MDLAGLAETSRPAQTAQSTLEALLAREYRLEGTLDRLGSERNETYRLRSGQESFLVKVSKPTEPFDSIDLQISAITHLARTTTLPVPRIRPTGADATTTSLAPEDDDQPCRTVYVMQFLAGSDLAARLLTFSQAQRVGEVHGQLTRALSDFHHPRQHRRLIWDLKELPALTELVEDLGDRKHQRLARQVMRAFERTALPLFADFDHQVVHGDFSVHNVLVNPLHPGFVAGIVDFGDTHRGPVVFDLAIAISNLLEHRLVYPWSLGARHLAGFLRYYPLPQQHRNVIAVCAVARSLQRALISGWRVRTDPAQADYVLEHTRDDWLNIEAALQTIGNAKDDFAEPNWYDYQTPSFGESP